MPTSAAIVSAVFARLTGQEHRLESKRPELPNGLCAGRLHGVAHDELGHGLAVDADLDVACSAPDLDAASSTTPVTPTPVRLANSVTGGSVPTASRAAAAIAAPIGCSDADSTAPASRRTLSAACRSHRRRRRVPSSPR